MLRFLRRLGGWLFAFFALLVRALLRLLIVLAFRPKRVWLNPATKKEAFRKPCVMISNHIRGMDGAVILTLLPGKRIKGLVARDWYERTPLMHFFLRCLPVIPLDREHTSLSWLRISRKEMKDGRSIYICPEGKCSSDKVIRPFRPGFVTLAAVAGADVLPIYHNGEYNYFFGKRFRMIIGEPIHLDVPPDRLSPEELERQCTAAREAMRSLEKRLNGTIREEQTDEIPH